MTLAGFPGGARTYLLVLVVPALFCLTTWPGRRTAATAGASGALAVAAGNLIGLANEGGGLGAVAYGAWLGSAGAVLLLAAALSCPPDAAPTMAERRRPALVERAVVAASLGVVLAFVWYSLGVDEPTRFASFVASVAF